jgi:hypothetical protein
MPTVSDQLAMRDSHTNPNLTAARFLLKQGRTYADAVEAFKPYTQVKEKNNEARAAGAKLIKDGKAAAKKKTFIYVNNRLEGNALQTISGMIDATE